MLRSRPVSYTHLVLENIIAGQFSNNIKLAAQKGDVSGCNSVPGLSLIHILALAGVMTAKLMPETGLVPAILLAVAASVLVGCIAGFFVGELDLQAMVITLGLMLGVRGAAQVLCDGRDIYFNKLGDVGEQLSLLGTYKTVSYTHLNILHKCLLFWRQEP